MGDQSASAAIGFGCQTTPQRENSIHTHSKSGRSIMILPALFEDTPLYIITFLSTSSYGNPMLTHIHYSHGTPSSHGIPGTLDTLHLTPGTLHFHTAPYTNHCPVHYIRHSSGSAGSVPVHCYICTGIYSTLPCPTLLIHALPAALAFYLHASSSDITA